MFDKVYEPALVTMILTVSYCTAVCITQSVSQFVCHFYRQPREKVAPDFVLLIKRDRHTACIIRLYQSSVSLTCFICDLPKIQRAACQW